MSKIAATVTVPSTGDSNNQYALTTGYANDPQAAIVAAVALQPATATVAADIATLVADGASPTQAHVNALNTAWGTFLTAFTAYVAAVTALDAGLVDANVTLVVDTTAVTKVNQVKAALASLLKQCVGTGKFTA